MIRTAARIGLALTLALAPLAAQEQRAMTYEDVMKFHQISASSISDDGRVVGFVSRPDRGDPRAHVHVLASGAVHRVERGRQVGLSADGRWAAVHVGLPFIDGLNRKRGEDKPSLVLIDLGTGERREFERVEAFEWTEDGRYLALRHHRPEKKVETERSVGKPVTLLDLQKNDETQLRDVDGHAFAPGAKHLVYAVTHPLGHNGLFHLDLSAGLGAAQPLHRTLGGRYRSLRWDEEGGALAFVHSVENEGGEAETGSILRWAPGDEGPAVVVAQATDGFVLKPDSRVQWAEDGSFLRFGVQEAAMAELVAALDGADEPSEITDENAYDFARILEERELDVWHGEDPFINPQQKLQWPREKRRTYTAIWWLDANKQVQIESPEMPQVGITDGSPFAVGRDDRPYRKARTWEGGYTDLYLVDLRDGSKRKVAEHFSGTASLSPKGNFLATYTDGDWTLIDTGDLSRRTLNEGIETPFANEDHDYPSDVPGYGVAGWMEDESAVFVQDKYDIWQFPTGRGRVQRMTGDGRSEERTYRIVRTDPDQRWLQAGQEVLLTVYDNRDKTDSFARGTVGQVGVRNLLASEHRYRFRQKAKSADKVLFTRESYDCFPDLWVANAAFEGAEQVSDLDAQREPFAWGQAQLVRYETGDGIPLDGVLIKPDNHEPGTPFPVIVYYYRFMSDRRHAFNPVLVNHRPCFPFYASNGYGVFLPDIRFEIGYPGRSATKCLLPGIDAIVAEGADPAAIGLHGHSWSGYQTAHVITETNRFAAAIAGAPVSNMTSAYSGIRWGSGVARQFQYEKTQSRIGGTLWDSRDKYIANSPVFFADRVETPLLIQFGDEDGAVPWYQGIELYLALRRNDKDVVFLQYRGEPHHLGKYANKLDYSIKFKEWFDHYLKGAPAPEWIATGMPYRGK